MNISDEVWKAAAKRGLDWVGTGGGCDYIFRRVKTEHHDCELTLNKDGVSPQTLEEDCEVGVAFHTSGYVSVALGFPTVTAALDFMAGVKTLYFMEDQYKYGKEEAKGLRRGEPEKIVRETPKEERMITKTHKRIVYTCVDSGVDGKDKPRIVHAFFHEHERDKAFNDSKNKAYLSKQEQIVEVNSAEQAALAKLDGLDKLVLGLVKSSGALRGS